MTGARKDKGEGTWQKAIKKKGTKMKSWPHLPGGEPQRGKEFVSQEKIEKKKEKAQ